MFKRIIVILAILCALGIGLLAGSSDLDIDLAISLGSSSATETSQRLTEKQVIDILVTELGEITIQNYGCFLECGSSWGKPSVMIDDDEWSVIYNGLHNTNSNRHIAKVPVAYNALFEMGDTDGVWKHTWTAQYTEDGWWLIFAKELGYWLLNEEREWVMTCAAFEVPGLMKHLRQYITTNAPNAENTCKQAVA